MSKIDQHLNTIKNVLDHVHSEKDLSIQDTKDIFANLLSIGYFTNNQELNTQMCANAALLLSTYIQSNDFKVHVDTHKTKTSDFNVNVKAIKPNEF